jgi:hypothetical protein
MSVCNAIENDMQKFCRFYKKSSCGHHCMFLHFDEYCDSLEAQKHARKIENDKLYGFAISDMKQVKNAETRVACMRYK